MQQENIKKGVIFLLIASFLFSTQQAFGKALYYISSFERTMYFCFFAACFLFIFCKVNKVPIRVKNKKMLFMRALFGFISTVCVFAAATKDYPIANVSLMSSTSTIFSMIVACLWLKERMNTGQFVSIIIAFFGVICILKPTSDLIHYEALIGLVGGASAGCAYTIVRYLKDESPYIIALFFSIFCVVASIPFVAYMGFSHIGLKELILLILTGLDTAVAQFALSKAYSYAPSTKISVYLYSQNLFSLLTGILIFHELPDIISIMGGILLICGGILNFQAGKKAYRTR